MNNIFDCFGLFYLVKENFFDMFLIYSILNLCFFREKNLFFEEVIIFLKRKRKEKEKVILFFWF